MKISIDKKLYCLYFLIVALLSKSYAQEKYRGFLPLPLFYYTPDTRFGAGLAGVYYWKIQNTDSTYTRSSYVQVLGDYTQNKQLDLWASLNMFTQEERFRIKADLRYRIFADRFYGIGNDSKPYNEEKFEYRFYSIQLSVLKNVSHHIFLGFNTKYVNLNHFRFEDRGVLSQQKITGAKAGNDVLFGVLLVQDSRDNILNASQGKYFLVSYDTHNALLGSNFDYHNFKIKYQKYWQIIPNHIIASQTFMNFNFGKIPFVYLATAGNNDILRAYPQNRFRDKHFIGTQVEYRFPLYKRIGMVAFSGIGDVFEKVNDIQLDRLKYSLGLGLRFMVKRKEKLNIRLDYGIGRKANSFYFMVSEAF